MTRNKIVWLNLLERIRGRGDTPLPSVVYDPVVPVVDLASSTLESIVVSATRAFECWLLPREIGKPILHPASARSIKGLKIFLDTWLLIVYEDGFAYLWDIREHAPRRGFYASLDLREPGVQWMSYAASLDPENENIILAMSGGTSM